MHRKVISSSVLEAVHSVIGIQKIEFDVHGIAFLTMLSDLCTPFKFADTFNARVVEGVGQLDKELLKDPCKFLKSVAVPCDEVP